MLLKDKCSPEGSFGLILAVLFSIIFVFYTFGIDFITARSDYWGIERIDVTQHVAGIAMYLSNPWHFPLLAFDSLNYPQGTRATFVDAIPIYALLIKIFLPKNPGFINPLGYWVALCFILQGVAAWWITKELQVKSWIFLIFLTAAFLTYPALMMRLKHISLLSHWIILFSIALYIRSCRLTYLPMCAWTVFLIVSFYVNIYLFLMALGIYFAAALEMRQKITFKRILSVFSPLLILTITLFLLLLPLPPVSLEREGGFDTYGMSLWAPFTGGKLIQWQIGMTDGQRAEGFNYLGLGVIIAFLAVIFTQSEKMWQLIKKYSCFFTIMLFYFFYSLSNHIYFGEQLIAIVPYPKFLDFFISDFRCASRFFWPIGYVIIIFSMYILHSRLKKTAFIVFACLLLAIQFIDLSDCYKKLKSNVIGHHKHIVNYAALDQALGKNVKHLYFYPKYKCTIKPYRNGELLPVTLYAAVRHLTLNTGYIARYRPACNDVKSEIAHSDHSISAYLFIPDEFANMQAILDLMGNTKGISCQKFNFAYVCKFKN